MHSKTLKIKGFYKKSLREAVQNALKRFEKDPRKAYVIVKCHNLRIRIYRGGLHCTCSQVGWYGSLWELRRLCRN